MGQQRAPQEFFFYRGRTALYVLLRALDIHPGDEILTQAYTCLAVVAPILGVGAIPIYADITPERFSFDPGCVEPLITSRTRVMIIQHTFGIPAEIDPLLEIARRHNLTVIEDCAHVSQGSYRGRPLGSFGAASIYSFQWSKPLVVGRGGSAVINDLALAERVEKLYQNFAWPSRKDRAIINLQYAAFNLIRRRKIFDYLRRAIRAISPSATGTIRAEELEGKITEEYNLRMAPNLQRRIASKRRDEPTAIARKRELGRRLHAHLQSLGVSPLDLPSDVKTTFLRYPVLASDRDRVIQLGRERDLEIEQYYTSPIDPLGRGDWPRVRYRAESCPRAEAAVAHTVTVPIHAWTTDETWNKVMAFFSEMRERGLLRPRLDL